MRDEVRNALQKLSKLDLSTSSCDEAKSLIRQFGKIGTIIETLHEGKVIVRARPNYNGERFHKRSELSYRPQEYNKTFQRASTPNRTMFYGTSIPEKLEPGELDNHRVIGLLESLSWLRDTTTKGFQSMTFGKWVVKKDIHLVALVHHEAFYKESSLTREIVNYFKDFISKHPEEEESTIAIMNFFASEFAKDVKREDPHYNYLLSAAFAENMVDMGLDGVFYPSMRVSGQGFNVAIRPEIADNNLELVGAGECSIYKLLERTLVDNETSLQLEPGQTDFDLPPIEPQYHRGQEAIFNELGIKSLDDLMQ